MSLINDALKKAQRMRTEGTPNPVEESASTVPANEPLQRVTRRDKPAAFRSQMLLAAGGVGAVVLLAGGAFFFLSSNETKLPANEPAKVATAPTTPAAANPPAPAATTPASAPISQTVTVTASSAATPPTPAPAATTPTPAAEPVVASASSTSANPAPAPVSVVAAEPAAPPAPPVAPPTPKPSSRMIGVIEHFKVGGIRVAGAESKVLMNDKVYRLKDVVDHELGIRLVGIEQKSLTFEDERGATYTRNF